MSAVLEVLGLALAACVVVGLAGAGLLHALGRSSIRHQLRAATLVPVLAVVAAVAVNVQLMLISAHDSGVVLAALGVSAALAVVMAWRVVRRIMVGVAQVDVGLRLLVAEASTGVAGNGSGVTSDRMLPPAPAAPSAPTAAIPRELARVSADLEKTRRTLSALRDREQQAERARRELVSFLSHDLRTPLSGLRALAEALEDGVITDTPRALAHLRATVGRMSGLVDDLFALSRVEGPGEPKPQRLVSLAEIVWDVTSELEATAAARDVALETEVPDDDRLAVLGVSDDLTRALANLVANAIRHTRPGATVHVGGRRADDGHVQVSVADACGGIPAENLVRVFDAGWRGSEDRAADGGAGLGLAIARGVVASHDGRIAVENVEDGCRFEVDLPSSGAIPGERPGVRGP